MRWYRHDPQAFLHGTAGLTLEAIGAYSFIIDLLYDRDGEVPDDDAFIARRLRVQQRTWLRVKAELLRHGKIWVIDHKLMAKRVEKELAYCRAKNVEKRRKKMGKIPIDSKNANENNDKKNKWVNQKPVESKSLREEIGESESRESLLVPDLFESRTNIRAAAKAGSTRVSEDFEKFWVAYPKRDGSNPKAPALKVFTAALKQGVEAEAIIAGAAAYAAREHNHVGTPYIAMAQTWLRQRRWEDERSQANVPDTTFLREHQARVEEARRRRNAKAHGNGLDAVHGSGAQATDHEGKLLAPSEPLHAPACGERPATGNGRWEH